MNSLYTIGILLYGFGIRIAAIFHPKARLWVKGRRGLMQKLEGWCHAGRQENGDPWKGNVWFHCASLGEFEQGRPVIEGFRELYPGYRIVVTFYSPSGYEVKREYAGADGVFYMPLDTPWNARRWLRILKPKMVFFVKYEYWFNFLKEIHRMNIPVFIISAVFHPNQPFFKRYGRWFRNRLRHVSWFFVQGEEAKTLAESLGVKNFTVTGDTRFDRVRSIREKPEKFPLTEQFAGESRIFLGGSTWEPDEALILGLVSQNIPGLKFIIAPHEVHEARIAGLEAMLRGRDTTPPRPSPEGEGVTPLQGVRSQIPPSAIIRYSQLSPHNASAAKILIIDTIGILAHLYRYATVSLIGGGFGAGIHNTLEAAAFGNPVIFGPNYRKFTEARELIGLGGAFSITGEEDLIRVAKELLNHPDACGHASSVCSNYVENGQGATRRILQGIQTLGFISPPGKTS